MHSAINLLTRRRARKMTTIKIVPDFPGAYGAKVDAWERQKRKEIALMPERAGYRPGMVLKPRPTATITVAAVQVSEEERAQFGKHYIGVQEGGSITPRKLSSSLYFPPGTDPSAPATPHAIALAAGCCALLLSAAAAAAVAGLGCGLVSKTSRRLIRR